MKLSYHLRLQSLTIPKEIISLTKKKRNTWIWIYIYIYWNTYIKYWYQYISPVLICHFLLAKKILQVNSATPRTKPLSPPKWPLTYESWPRPFNCQGRNIGRSFRVDLVDTCHRYLKNPWGGFNLGFIWIVVEFLCDSCSGCFLLEYYFSAAKLQS